MKLGTEAKRLLYALQFNAGAHVPEIAKRSGIRVHTVHYHLRHLKESGVLRRGVFLNLALLGFSEFEILFSVRSASETLRRRLLNYLQKHNRVIWIAELGGRFRYGVTFCAKHAVEAAEFTESLEKNFGRMFLKKSVSTVIEKRVFSKRYLLAENAPLRGLTPEILVSAYSGKLFELDTLDRQILAILFHGGWNSHQDIARALGEPRATVEYRLKKLEQNEVIHRHIYFISGLKLGRLVFKLLLFSRGLRSDLTKNLAAFCAQEPALVGLIHCFGAWDYELLVEAANGEELIEIQERLQAKFPDSINDIEVLPVFQQTTSRGFLAQTL